MSIRGCVVALVLAGCGGTPSGGQHAMTVCPGGDGTYCGNNGAGGDDETLYSCKSGVFTELMRCGHGCRATPPGGSDTCPDMSNEEDGGIVGLFEGTWITGLPSSFDPVAYEVILSSDRTYTIFNIHKVSATRSNVEAEEGTWAASPDTIARTLDALL